MKLINSSLYVTVFLVIITICIILPCGVLGGKGGGCNCRWTNGGRNCGNNDGSTCYIVCCGGKRKRSTGYENEIEFEKISDAFKCFMSSKAPANIKCLEDLIQKDLLRQYAQQQSSNLDEIMTTHLKCLITQFEQSANLIDVKKIVTAVSNKCKAIILDPLILAMDESLIKSLIKN